MTKEDLVCEEHFIKTHYREKSGRYVVRLPFKEPPPAVNDTYQVAVSRFKRVERALKGQPTLWTMYKDFMYGYEYSNHMKLVQPGEQQPLIYLPHNHVCRLDSSSTKLRVVFDGSSKMNDGCSLNDRLYRGHKLQKNIVDVITHFRFPALVFTANIRQMFRQIQVHGEDQQFQGIVWRDDSSKPIQSYRLSTVTYGLITSPYHALRVLKQLALDEQNNYPIGSKILLNDFYVDEVMTGGDNLSEVLHKIQELTALLNQGGFELRKWASNHREALQHIPSEHQIKEISFKEDIDFTIKILGINWNTTNNTFTFKAEPMKVISHLTKRELLSKIARNFDPCGWLAPLVVVAKLIMQQLWQERLEWDDTIPQHLFNAWKIHRTSFKFLNTFKVPRHIMNSSAHSTFLLHGFGDSSEKAYAAVVYLVSTQKHSASMLLTAKTRVAPIKKMTIPRLELCGALLLAELTNALLKSTNINIQSVNLWLDSIVTLHWIGSDPARWLTFVSNRVGQIQTLTPSAVWRYVPSADNPADVASRGSNGQELTANQLWWNGPRWLTTPAEWPVADNYENSTFNIEERTVQCSMAITTTSGTSSSLLLLNRHSNLERLLRIVSYIIQFCRNCRPKANPTAGSCAVSERRQAMEYWIRAVQGAEFIMELTSLSRQQNIRTNCQLAGLNPFIDEKGILRIGGRLKHSELGYNMKHPIIIPKNHSFATMIINQVLLHNLHSSLSVTMTLLRQRY
ncbi:uncharacterized protein LOC115033071 [Acyrthosiphon pisum]|uniref:Uncharacterized protein n=1 Tax=Acyrthosiphon pisum TaxID=7029 RepID=A0A8R2JKK9_ACYPI|nr:uncharacterized protein LOC115033071 [Acyrthosiphon pisum]